MKRAEVSPALGRRLAGRLYPVALLIGVFISTGLPTVHYLLGSRLLHQGAASYAQEVAGKIEKIGSDAPDLWKYQVEKYAPVLQDFLAHKEVLLLNVLDEESCYFPVWLHQRKRERVVDL